MDFLVSRIAETGSTNDDLAAAAQLGAPHGSVLVTDHQTTGKGRLGRTWTAPPGSNLLVSVLFREDIETPHRLVQLVSVAMAEAIETVSPTRPVLKWPNDLLVGDAKLAGVLAQAGGTANRIDWVVVGIGVNVGWAPEGGARVEHTTPPLLFDAWLPRLGLDDDIDQRYRARLYTLGRSVRVEAPNETFVGIASDVLADGRLVVTNESGQRIVGVGDVTHLRHT